MAGDAQVPTSDVDELRVALGRPHSGKVADGPDRKADQPEAQAETEGCGERAVRMAMLRGAPPSRMCSVKAR